MFEGNFSPPVYNDLYNFLDGAQNDIFIDSYVSIPTPAPNASLPVLANLSGANSSSTTSSTSNSNSNSTTSGKTCKQKKTASPSPSLSSTSKYLGSRDMRRSHQSSIMAMSRRSRRLSINKRERLWNVW